ncbi:MAG: Wzz/FepE/Etk N-terminal domain-containing protein, partial [Amphritea sp.]|nr:Wzz/FepE/Etk N-terminal domain-containing protein [Amphritea sp.]
MCEAVGVFFIAERSMVHKSEPDFPSPAYSSQSEQQEFDLENLLRAVWRGKLWVLCFAVLASCVGFYYAFYVAKPIYTSSATVVLQS